MKNNQSPTRQFPIFEIYDFQQRFFTKVCVFFWYFQLSRPIFAPRNRVAVIVSKRYLHLTIWDISGEYKKADEFAALGNN
jgi:hypothetical protein